MPPSLSLGHYIQERRRELGLTQEQLAEAIGDNVKQSDVSRLERNKITLPRRERLEQLAMALEVSLGDLLARTGWLTAGDDLELDLVREVAHDGEVVPASPEEIHALIQAVEDARTVISSALGALATADAALDTAMRRLHAPGERGRVQHPAGVFMDWETALVFPA